eukprot:365080-Chlamydomonas_euryale.AAC.8
MHAEEPQQGGAHGCRRAGVQRQILRMRSCKHCVRHNYQNVADSPHLDVHVHHTFVGLGGHMDG